MMNITKLLFAITAFLVSLSLSAQVKVNPEIQKKFDSFIELSNQKKWNEAFDLMYPKLFISVPKQDLVNIMTSMDQDGLALKMSNIQIESTTVPIEENGETFVKLAYTANLTVEVAEKGLYNAPKAIQGMTEQFQTAYGKTNVKFDDANKTYHILAHKSIMAIQSNNQWYLLEINTDQMELMESLFSPSVMDALVRTE